MVLGLEKGVINSAEQIASPNFDDRPEGCRPEVLIIHSISLPPGEYQSDYVERFFCNELNPEDHSYFQNICHLTVSSHFYIRRNGKLIQFVNTEKRAWHAGVSKCLDREAVNDFSIGIELEGWDEGIDGFSDKQYKTLIELTKVLQEHYEIPKNHVFGHSDIAPNRKNDPGPYFDWDHYKSQLI